MKVVLIVTALLHIAGCDEHDHKYEVLPMIGLKMVDTACRIVVMKDAYFYCSKVLKGFCIAKF